MRRCGCGCMVCVCVAVRSWRVSEQGGGVCVCVCVCCSCVTDSVAFRRLPKTSTLDIDAVKGSSRMLSPSGP